LGKSAFLKEVDINSPPATGKLVPSDNRFFTVSAIFISYTGRDAEGDAWADRLSAWFSEWNYGYFRDKDHSHGVKAGDDWRAALYAELDDATAMVCLCSQQYDSSPWCVAEVAIAVEKGKTVIPIQLANTADELKQEPLPLLLQTRQAIQVAGAKAPSQERLAEVKQRLQATLREKLNWRDLRHWDRSLPPYPGLPAFEEQQAPVFFGRDKTIEAVVERLEALALRPGAFLLLLGASGYGKSSLVRAGVAPRLSGAGSRGWTVLPPFTPGDAPFQELEEAVAADGGDFDPSDPLGSLQALQRRNKKPVLLVIDQFEELLTAGQTEEGAEVRDTADPGELFQAFLLKLLRARKPGLIVLATMRTDFLAPLQSRWPALTAMASTTTLEPIQPEDFGVLITGPAKRASLTLEAGLETRLVKESGGRDALPLLAFTLEKLWKERNDQRLTLKSYEALGGVEGAVSTRAKECWNPHTSSEQVREALREAFLDHLVSIGTDGLEGKRPAHLDALPIASREIVQRMVNDRLLVLNDGIVEIAHEALLRTWEPLVNWIKEGKEELLQRNRVLQLSRDLNVDRPLPNRLGALQALLVQAQANPQVLTKIRKVLEDLLDDGSRCHEENFLTVEILELVGDSTSAEALGAFLQRINTNEPLVHTDAGQLLQDLCNAAKAMQACQRRDPPVSTEDTRWLLIPSSKVSVNKQDVCITTDLVRLRLWATPRLHGQGVWFQSLGDGISLTMVNVPPGSFEMGSPYGETGRQDIEKQGQKTELEEFAIGQMPITQAQWRAVASWEPCDSSIAQLDMIDHSRFKGDDLPIDGVSRINALEFCVRLCRRTGLVFTLPSQAQWEYACRAGTRTAFHCGDTITSELANFDGTNAYASGPSGYWRAKTIRVGSFPSNDWGICDMHGNVREICRDTWEYDGNANKDKTGISSWPLRRPKMVWDPILRGGSWYTNPKLCRSASRHRFIDSSRGDIGFRVVCMKQEPEDFSLEREIQKANDYIKRTSELNDYIKRTSELAVLVTQRKSR
jgi:formylglycine-generating enzyme required for sulfatase activity/energy-coupling factor transporter ATP-binding protein EcfA2